MTRLSPQEREDDSFKSWELWLVSGRERRIRDGETPPNPNKPDEVRWAAEGPCLNRDLDCVRGRE
jgi:hypothetical protein